VAAVEGIFLARPAAVGEGIRLAVKDLLDTEGLVTTYGSAIFVDHVPNQTAESVQRLEAAGYANVGKTNMHEFAYGITSENVHFGNVPNPIAPGRIPGGSSGGSGAALAAGLADAALGTDSGGSIRIPAACCGIVGFKPTFDLVPTAGCFPLAPSFDHVGPMARSVEACEEMLVALAPDFEPTAIDSLDDLHVGIAWLDDAEPSVRDAVTGAISHFRARSNLDLPRADVEAMFMHEVAGVHRELFEEHAELYGENVAVKIERCLAVTDADAAAAARRRDDYRADAERLVGALDLLLTPTLPVVTPRVGIGDLELRGTLTRNTLPVNALGWPALAIPCGEADGLPTSLQLVGPPGTDALVLAAGKHLASLL
jgi:aspartyl-tRNA(Asn)/glutamyl-tRNA(Gln) amidotransferase subunit A